MLSYQLHTASAETSDRRRADQRITKRGRYRRDGEQCPIDSSVLRYTNCSECCLISFTLLPQRLPIGGEPTNALPSVGAIVEMENNAPSTVVCSGTLIAPNVVLSASHCFRRDFRSEASRPTHYQAWALSSRWRTMPHRQ